MSTLRLFLFVVLSGCVFSESGLVEVQLCPNCSGAYSGFETCAFFDAAHPTNQTILDADSFEGVGIPLSLSGYMHHKFCFNETHVVFGSANPTVNGLEKNPNYVVFWESSYAASNFASEYEYLLGRGSGEIVDSWEFNGQSAEMIFCPRMDCVSWLVDHIDSASDSVMFLSFVFSHSEVSDALIRAHNRGVCVFGLVESRNHESFYSQIPALQAAGVPVFAVSSPGVFHHKAFFVDGKSILGSFNPSVNAATRNAEVLVFLEDSSVFSSFESVFPNSVCT